MRNHQAGPAAVNGVLRAAARRIIALERHRLPDLTGLTLLLPNFHAIEAMGEALCAECGVGAILLPTMTTLPAWAENVPIQPGVVPDSCRAALLYEALRARKWFPDGDLWQICSELLGLFDDLARQGTRLPETLEDFIAALEHAYQGRAGTPLQFEARLVHELWYAMGRGSDDRVDRVTAYHMKLARLAEEAAGPLYAVGLAGLTPMEQSFFAAYGLRHGTHLFGCDEMTLPEDEADALTDLLRAAWQPISPEAGLRERAADFAGRHHASPLPGRLLVYPAQGLEQEALAVDAKIREWLGAGKSRIAIIAQDRLVARRARALLERSQILVEDETGWTFSTVSASSVIMRWLDAMASQFHHLDLLDLLKSPLIFADWDESARKSAVYGLEQLVRRHSIVSGLGHYRALAQREPASPDLPGTGVLDLLGRLEQAQRRFGSRKRTLSDWLFSLRESLDILGLRLGLERDLAGEHLLRLLDRLQHELEQERSLFSLSEWRRWLDAQLEAATFRDSGVTSPVVLTHLGATRLRRFDGVIVAGGDAAHFPGGGTHGVFFNQAVRAQLGLPTLELELRDMQQDFSALLANCGELLVVWQARINAEPNLASPWIERLEAFHELAYGEKLPRSEMMVGAGLPAIDAADRGQARSCTLSSPVLPPELVPAALSASGYNSLMACPYQFYARHALHLNELDEVQQALEKKDYGEHVHAILHRFHQRYPVIAGIDRAELEQALRDISREEFARALEADYLARAWSLRWEARIPAYLDWQEAREQAGWRWHEGELWRTRELALDGGRSLTLKGRIDRVDIRSDDDVSAYAVLDYKTQNYAGLQKKLAAPGEDVQLPVYALLLDKPVVEAAFVPVDDEGVREVEQEEIHAVSEAVLHRLGELFNLIHRGAPLPAQGGSQACGWCEMSGLCRKDYRDEA